MPNTKTGTTWAPDIRPGAIETFTETYTPDGGGEQTVEYKRVADHPILNGIRDIKAFFTTHVGAVWYNLAERKTLLDKLNEMDAKIKQLKFVEVTIDSITISSNGFADISANILPDTREYLFATVSYFGVTSKKACFSVHGARRAFWATGIPGDVIPNLRLRFWYM